MKRPKPAGLSLAQFAGAKTSTHDKQRAQQKRKALAAGRVNRYRKIKHKYAQEGKHNKIVQPDSQVPNGPTATLLAMQLFQGCLLPTV